MATSSCAGLCGQRSGRDIWSRGKRRAAEEAAIGKKRIVRCLAVSGPPTAAVSVDTGRLIADPRYRVGSGEKEIHFGGEEWYSGAVTLRTAASQLRNFSPTPSSCGAWPADERLPRLPKDLVHARPTLPQEAPKEKAFTGLLGGSSASHAGSSELLSSFPKRPA